MHAHTVSCAKKSLLLKYKLAVNFTVEIETCVNTNVINVVSVSCYQKRQLTFIATPQAVYTTLTTDLETKCLYNGILNKSFCFSVLMSLSH